jgi:formate hydrogenlyase subunit 3/multisubunit Na+/H+ antiporter MnhD subunit
LIYLSFLSLSGFPPFPLFFIKAYVIFLSMSLSYIIVVLLIFSALVLVSYIRSLFHFATFHFATFRSFLLFWWVSLCKNFSLQN